MLHRAFWVGGLGLVLSTWGFYLWYFRLQCFQDQITRAEAEKALASLRPGHASDDALLSPHEEEATAAQG